jgi:hypothetical protein
VRDAVANDPLTSELMEAMLAARAALWKQYPDHAGMPVTLPSESDG